MEYCEQNGITPKLHCLIYDKFFPEWLDNDSEEETVKYYEERFRQISERYAGRMMEFEVINETLVEPDWDKRTAISRRRDVIEWAFALARKYFPNETLVMNENKTFFYMKYGYRHPYFMQLENALMKGAEIDKIGLQYHIFTGCVSRNEEEYEKAVRSESWMADPSLSIEGGKVFGSLGLPLEITEVTVPTFGETEKDEELQAEILKNLFTVWFSIPQIDTVVYWNTVDGYAYFYGGDENGRGYWNENQCHGGLFHNDLSPKKSAVMLKKLFSEMWHTNLEITTDENGDAEIRGFYGDYDAKIDNETVSFGIHKYGENAFGFEVKS